MKNILPFIFLCACAGIKAQPVFTRDWFPVAGDSFVMNFATGSQFSITSAPPAGGTNQVWNFSQLQLSSNTYSDVYLDSAGYPNYAGCNLRLKQGNSIVSLQTGTDTVLNYLSSGPNSRWVNYAVFPLTYLSAFQGSTSYNDSYTSSYQGRQVTADGWGKLILPTDSFENVLRLKISSTYSSGSYSPYSSDHTTNSQTTVSYQWIHPSVSHALLTLDYNYSNSTNTSAPPPYDQSSDSVLKISVLTTAIQLAAAITTTPVNDFSFSLFPNPTLGIMQIVFASETNTLRTLQITDLTGKLILSKPVKELNSFIDISAFAPGVYLVSINDINEGRRVMQKIVKQ